MIGATVRKSNIVFESVIGATVRQSNIVLFQGSVVCTDAFFSGYKFEM